MTKAMIEVENVSKKFCRDLKRSLWYGLKDIGKEMLGQKHTGQSTLRKHEFWALDDINFKLKRGERLGLIGRNGAGKTTLLRLLNGLIKPNSGKITIYGRIGALIALGAGFNPILTGRENIYINGSVLGLTKKEVDKKLDQIIEFAEIEDFIDTPVQNYSSGMQVKLGFSVAAILLEPDILLLDEVLAVGDVGFQLKCFELLGELKANNTSIILISHNLHQISTFCDNLIVLHRGRIVHNGILSEGLAQYKHEIASLKSEGQIEKVNTGTNNFEILDVQFTPTISDNVINMQNGEDLKFTIEYQASKEHKNIEIDIVIRLPIPTPTDYFQATNRITQNRLDVRPGRGKLTGTIKNINLNNTRAYLFITIWEEERKTIILWWRNIPMDIKGNVLSQGWTYFDMTFTNEQ